MFKFLIIISLTLGLFAAVIKSYISVELALIVMIVLYIRYNTKCGSIFCICEDRFATASDKIFFHAIDNLFFAVLLHILLILIIFYLNISKLYTIIPVIYIFLLFFCSPFITNWFKNQKKSIRDYKESISPLRRLFIF